MRPPSAAVIYTAIIKSLVRRDGLRVRGSAAHLLQEKITALNPSPQLLEELQPLFAMLVPLHAQIEAADGRVSALEKTDPAVALLMSAPGIGTVTTSAVVAVADDITRFDSAHQFEAFLGLVPSELSSGDKRHIGHITKAGNARVRYLLVEVAWRIIRSKQDDTAALRAWANRVDCTGVASVAAYGRRREPLVSSAPPLPTNTQMRRSLRTSLESANIRLSSISKRVRQRKRITAGVFTTLAKGRRFT